MGDSMRISVDEQLCQASGYCERVAPAIFAVAGDVAEVLASEVNTVVLIGQATEAESICPARAIRLASARARHEGANP